MRIVFMGTPDFAAESLNALIQNNFEVIGVFCQPDRASGRGMEISYCPVKKLALDNGIPVYQPVKMRDGEALNIIKSLNPDLLVVVAYGKILPDDILAVPSYGAINVHGSLLPKYRGAAPIQWSVINGDSITGVTTMYLATEMDSGDIIYQAETEIGEKETSGQLYDRLKVIGAELLIRTVNDIISGVAPRTAQNNSEASYVTMLDKSMCPIDFGKDARHVLKHIYGMQPWPVATWNDLKVFSCEINDETTEADAGTVISTDRGIEIACGDGKSVILTEVQAPGKKRMNALDYLRGHKIEC